MTAVSKTNRFFVDNVYSNLGIFATSPFTGWEINKSGGGSGPIPSIDFEGLGLKLILWPILIPLTVVTASIALSLSLVAGFIHLLSLAVAATADVCNTASGLTA